MILLAHTPVPMFAALPIWPTTKSVLAYTWLNRALALRYTVVPFALLVAFDATGLALGIDIAENPIWQYAAAIASTVAYAPLVVTWYLTMTNDPAARPRPWFTYGFPEGTVVMTNILISLVFVIVAFPLGALILLPSAAVARLNDMAGQIAAVTLIIPAAFIGIMIFTRLSVTIPYAASGGYLRLRDAWLATRGIGVRFTIVHMIVGVIGVGIASAIVAILGLGVDVIGWDEKDPIVELGLCAADTLFGVIYLLLSTTLFGLVYRKLNCPEPSAES